MMLRIGHLDYTVRLFRVDERNDGCWGDCCTHELEIRLARSDPARQLDTLIHEISHAAWDAYGMPDAATEEQVATFIGRAFAAVLRANPHLLPVLMALRDGGSFVDEVANG